MGGYRNGGGRKRAHVQPSSELDVDLSLGCPRSRVENVVSEVTERAGVGGISLATVYHAGRFLQPRSPRRKVYFPEDGTVYFDITPSKYDSSLIKPQVSSEMARGGCPQSFAGGSS